MSREKRTFTEEFKTQIVELYKRGKPIKELAKEYGIHRRSIMLWIEQNKRDEFKYAFLTPEQVEIKELREQLNRALLENEILKKAALILGKSVK